MSSNLSGYNKNDFFYVKAFETGDMPSEEVCAGLGIHNNWDISCNYTEFADNSMNCINRELCVNKEKAELLNNLSVRTNGAEEKYSNYKKVFDYTYTHTVNLTIGTVILLILIYRNRPT